MKEKWWKNDEIQSKCEKPEDQSDGISIQNIGGVFIVIFVGIGMACVTLIFEYWYYKFRKGAQVIDVTEAQNHENMKNPTHTKNSDGYGIQKVTGRLEGHDDSNTTSLRTRYQFPKLNIKSRF